METRIVFHIDFDYFYAQCEEIRSPELKSKPVCVCVFSDRGGDSGAVATANYAAREFGVKSGIPIMFAKKRLEGRKDAVFLPVDFDYYEDMSEKAMDIIKEHADVFEYVGKDEAYLDVTGRVGGSFDRATHLGQQVKNSIREKTKLGCSIGISPNKLISKIASDFQKPDGLTVVLPDRSKEFLERLQIRTVPGIGKKAEKKFSEMGLETVKDVRNLDVFTLNKEFGRKGGTYIYNAVRGIDEEPVRERESSVQYSRIMTLKRDSKDYEFLAEGLEELCRGVHEAVKKDGRMFKLVGVHFVQSDLSNRSKSRTLRNPTLSLEELQKTAHQLLGEALENQTDTIRRLGVRVAELSEIQGQSDITSYF